MGHSHSHSHSHADADEVHECGGEGFSPEHLGLRVGALFIILVTSLIATLAPIIAHRSKMLSARHLIFDITKYFGSGVIIATAFIHLLAPAFEELGAECLTGAISEYDWAPAIAMMAVFAIFIVEILAFRIGTNWLRSVGFNYATHGEIAASHGPESPANHRNSTNTPTIATTMAQSDPEKEANLVSNAASSPLSRDVESGSGSGHNHSVDDEAQHAWIAQIVGVAILELGVILHSIIIGLLLAVTDEFKILFVVIIFHQMFEGLGLGSRLAQLSLPSKYRWIPVFGGALYSLITPLGLAIGLGVRQSYDPASRTALIVSGVLDSFSAGILLYTGLVELLAHEFLFNRAMKNASTKYLLFAISCTMLGAAMMALLGKWA